MCIIFFRPDRNVFTVLFLSNRTGIYSRFYFYKTGQEYICDYIFSDQTGIYSRFHFFRDQTGIYPRFYVSQTGQEYIRGCETCNSFFKLVQAASLIDGREASGSDVAVDAFLSLARYADGQYQNIVDYMKSPTYEAKQSLMQQARLETEKMRSIGQTSRYKFTWEKFTWEILFADIYILYIYILYIYIQIAFWDLWRSPFDPWPIELKIFICTM